MRHKEGFGRIVNIANFYYSSRIDRMHQPTTTG